MQATPRAGMLVARLGPVPIARLARISLVVGLTGLFSVSLGPMALAETDHWTACRGADPDTQIAGCTEIVARGKRETKRNRTTAYINRGGAYLAKGDLDRAIADFGKAIAVQPQSAAAFLGRGEAYRAKGDLDHARLDLASATRLDPRLAAARAALEEVDRLIAERAAPSAQALPASSAEPSMKSVPDTLATPPKEAAPTAPAGPPAQSSSDRSVHASPLTSKVLFHIGPVPITTPVVTTWAIMLVSGSTTWLVTRRLRSRPDRRQAVLEAVVTGIMQQIEDILRKDPRPYLTLLGTLFLFLVTANLVGLLPGGEAPTSKLETPAALAFIVFVSVHFFGVRARGILGYLASFAEPKLVMLPLNIVSEVTRTFSLMVRLFGNVMSGEFVVALVVGLAGLFVPIPLMALEVLVGVVQAYIFTVLATVFIGAAIGSVEKG